MVERSWSFPGKAAAAPFRKMKIPEKIWNTYCDICFFKKTGVENKEFDAPVFSDKAERACPCRLVGLTTKDSKADFCEYFSPKSSYGLCDGCINRDFPDGCKIIPENKRVIYPIDRQERFKTTCDRYMPNELAIWDKQREEKEKKEKEERRTVIVEEKTGQLKFV